MNTPRKRTLEAVKNSQADWHPTNPQHEDIAEIIDGALDLEQVLYAGDDYRKELFTLRKALEGVFGNDLPYEE